ncbi:MAG: T9SS type A sorting domain-containing protein [Bacteroidetes bacterium]|nr:T9SS type A sorting domain-containing protein [Bacteroidota bacterium]
MKKSGALLLLMLVFAVCIVHAQKQYNQWFFGMGCGVDFNSGTPTFMNGSLLTDEGCATWCDVNGQVLIYTNGVSVYNKNHALMPNGTGLNSSVSSTEGAIIVPLPGSASIFYIFTTFSEGMYSIVDLSLNGGNGDVTVKNTLLQSNTNERLSYCKHANGVDYWIMFHGDNTSTFYAFLLTSAGVSSAPVTSTVGVVQSTFLGYMKFNAQASKVACALHYQNTIELFDFDNATGMVTNPVLFPANYPNIYGLEFSLSGKYMYISYGLQNGVIKQFNISSGLLSAILASEYQVGTISSLACGALQMGPDRKIYNSSWGNYYLSCINNPEDSGVACNFVLQQVPISLSVTAGLPNCLSSAFGFAEFDKLCYGDTALLMIQDSGLFAAVAWDFDDPTTVPLNVSYDFSTSHVFSAPGMYKVQLVLVSLNASVDTFYYDIEIETCNQVVAALASSDTLFCDKNCIDFFDQSQFNPTSWQWTFTGASPAASTDQNPIGICYNNYGSFDVTLIACNAAGCDTVLMPNFITEFQLPAAPVITLTGNILSSTPAFSYQWFVVGDTTIYSTSQSFTPTVNGNYYVLINDSNGCQSPSNVVGFYTGIHSSDDHSISIFPNPFNEYITVSDNQNRMLTYTIYDVAGKQLQRGSGHSLILIDARKLAPGYYTIVIISPDKTKRIPLVKSQN